eukprot:2258390-Prymnesium_polylepis.2
MQPEALKRGVAALRARKKHYAPVGVCGRRLTNRAPQLAAGIAVMQPRVVLREEEPRFVWSSVECRCPGAHMRGSDATDLSAAAARSRAVRNGVPWAAL